MKAGKPLSLYVNPVLGFHVMVHLVFKMRKASVGLSVLFIQSIISCIFEQNCNIKQISHIGVVDTLAMVSYIFEASILMPPPHSLLMYCWCINL